MTAPSDDTPFHRPNYLGPLSLVLGLVTLTLMGGSLCAPYCVVPLLSVPTAVCLLTGWLGLRLSKETRQGRETAVVGLILGFLNLLISLFWLALLAMYAMLFALVALLENM